MLEIAALVDDAAEQTAITDALLTPSPRTALLAGQSALLMLELALHLIQKSRRQDFDGRCPSGRFGRLVAIRPIARFGQSTTGKRGPRS